MTYSIELMTSFAIVFPGQGSQAVGMLDAWGDHPIVRQTLEEASEALGQNMAQLIAQGPKELLDLTTHTQPVMLTAGIACWRVWADQTQHRPQFFAGHSLGEYTALVAAGALSLVDALPLVRLRAQAMQAAVPVGTGGMAAILGLEAAAVKDVCAQISLEQGEVLQAVNFNDPKQTVIAGTQKAVELACVALKAQGAKRALVLPVSAPFHCSLMAPAAQLLREHLSHISIQAPHTPVINNIDVCAPTEPHAIADALYRQAFGPVRWVEIVQKMCEQGISHLVECGPGKVLCGLAKRISPELSAWPVFDPASLQAAQGALFP
jgi:[acyl-carrier-protein] S-malonyltransferase